MFLVKANASENEKTKLSEEELLGVMRCVACHGPCTLSADLFIIIRVVILAGHETTANTLSWMLLELMRQPDIQTKLRQEILAMRQTTGDSYTTSDLDSMPYLNAFLKVKIMNALRL